MTLHFRKGIFGNNYGYNIEQTKPVPVNVLIVNSLLGELSSATKQAAGRKGVLQLTYTFSNSNLNKLIRDLRNLSFKWGLYK